MTGCYVDSLYNDDPHPGYDAHEWANDPAADAYLNDRLLHDADDNRKTRKEDGA